MDAFSDNVQCAAINRSAVLFPSGVLFDTSADKVNLDNMEPEVDDRGRLPRRLCRGGGHVSDLGVRASVPGVQWLDGFDF